MTVYILSALLLAVLAYAVFQLTQKTEVEKEIEKLTQQDESYLLAELYSVNFTVWLCFAGGLLLTANYAITYFSGSEVRFIAEWSFYQWTGAFIGLVVTVSITSVQKILYASPTHHKAGLLVTTLILIFVIFSEIGSPIEKEEMKMKQSSQNSPTYQAVVGAINNGNNGGNQPSGYAAQLATAKATKATHQFELNRCTRHKAKGQKRIEQCKTYENRKIAQAQAQIDTYQQAMQAESMSQQTAKLALVDKAKALENNTDNHSGLIKFVKQALATSYLSAMMFASLILVVAFEAGFHFAGSRAGILKAALIKMGNKDILYASEHKRMRKAEKYRAKIDPTGWENAAKTTKKKDNKPTENHPIPEPETTLKTADKTNPDNLVGKAPPDLADKVGQGDPQGKVKPMDTAVLSGNSFDKLYAHVSSKVKTKKIKPSAPALRKCVKDYVKNHEKLKASAIALPECGYLADQIRDRMLEEGIIKENPNYKNGLAKYMMV